MPGDGHLDDRMAEAAGEGEDLEVEGPAVDGGAREEVMGGVGGEGLEPALRVVDARDQRALDEEVDEAAPEAAPPSS